MASNNQSSKGNGAAKRMSNPKLKEKRQRAWQRAQKRNDKNRAENLARQKANDAMLKAHGLTRTLTTVQVMRDGKLVTVQRPDSPQRTMRLAGVTA
jgi:hypothetical protein